MATEFRSEETGVLVARRNWGGIETGCVVSLEPGAVHFTMDTPLRGDDGSLETLRSLSFRWARAGQGNPSEYIKGRQHETR
jgi:hypothetical protein